MRFVVHLCVRALCVLPGLAWLEMIYVDRFEHGCRILPDPTRHTITSRRVRVRVPKTAGGELVLRCVSRDWLLHKVVRGDALVRAGCARSDAPLQSS